MNNIKIKFGEKKDPKRPKIPGTDNVYFTDMKKEGTTGSISLYDNDKEVGEVLVKDDVFVLRVSSGESREIHGYYMNKTHDWQFKTTSSAAYNENKKTEYAKFFNTIRYFHNSKDTSRKAFQTFSIGKAKSVTHQ